MPPKLSPRAWLRWAWNHLTTMRTALVLLFLLALAAIPGSALPQRTVSVEQVDDFYVDYPELAPWLDQLYLFDVYSSPWFAAIYLLLFTSLVGCVIPRMRTHLRALRSPPPAAPRHFERLPYSARFTTTASPDTVLAEARRTLRGHRVRTSTDHVAGERGYLRETGNLLFHASLVGLLVALAAGSLLGYRGNMLVVEGDGFANAVPSYDAFHPGAAVDSADLEPFTFWLEDFEASFVEDGQLRGQAENYTAELRYRETPDGPEQYHDLEVNHPLSVQGAQVYLLGHGYAPEFTVTDATGEVVFDQAVPFLPSPEAEDMIASEGVVKVPDTSEEQLGFRGVFLPSPTENAAGELISDFPAPRDPIVTLDAYQGDLGLDSGESQSVYQLQTEFMEEIGTTTALGVGDTWELPDGAGTITFTGYSEYISMEVTSDPGRVPALVASSVAVAALLLTLLVRPRRCWIRVHRADTADAETVVEVGGLSKTDHAEVTADFHAVTTRLRNRLRGDSRASQ
ncbi:cytochrome c biogenesis protein ResB [Lipingzhangella sp. LS1_29]|uniref:Cytochrome c biogenesis protein ResB n=1 Tax=Lipingzhangella rawalii TaxID=2055835 RepID=A0ABU2H8U7_9ACTN|nr:cytochrome c biogenesis protein ResB [Lipingzhangella rawalii]MDS1271733.1 cytochrome c biogenesis protein ResB [Lipingzhangella rawalii]